MKKVTKFFMAALLAGMFSLGYAQNQPDYMKGPKASEKIIGTISDKTNGGNYHCHYIYGPDRNYFTTKEERNEQSYSEDQLYQKLLEKAIYEYGDTHPGLVLRDFKSTRNSNKVKKGDDDWIYYEYVYSASVVVQRDAKSEANEKLSQALNKALRNVQEGSRLAIDQVTITSIMDRGEFKDQLIDVLLDKGYKVVAKEYLEKLYEEQQAQQSGIYNERTTVKENNFSAVGYFINVKVTETSLRVQVVNVSTGEYEGNATVNF